MSDLDQSHAGQYKGIKCTENKGSIYLVALGSIIFLVGISIGGTIAFDALRIGNIAIVLVGVALILIGIASLYLAIRNRKTFTKLGATALVLDPVSPGVGGQLGASFSLNPAQPQQGFSTPPVLRATLSCREQSKTTSSDHSGRSNASSERVIWQKRVPVYLVQTARGFDASFVFEIPDTCQSSSKSDIRWSVTVDGDIAGLGLFERNWKVEVGKVAASSAVVKVPSEFTEKAEEKARQKAKVELTKRIPVKNDSNYIDFSSSTLPMGSGIAGLLFGLIFAAVGCGMMWSVGWGGGVAFIFIGVIGGGVCLFAAAKKTEVKIEKQSQTLFSRTSLFGRVLSSFDGKIESADQFSIDLIGSADMYGELISMYNVNFTSTDGQITKLAGNIEGELAANSFKDGIVEQLFTGNTKAAAA